MGVHTRLAAVTVAALLASVGSSAAQPGSAVARDKSVKTQAAVIADARPTEPGRVDGLVTDERGQPLGGAAVTLAGGRLLFAVSDATGHFRFEHVQPGTYLLRVHLAGFAASPRFEVGVAGDTATFMPVRLSRTDAAAGLVRPIMKAGVGVGGDDADNASGEEDHTHTPMAWRLRHLKRTVLREKDGTPEDVVRSEEQLIASSLYPTLPVSGQVQLLTTSAFDNTQQLFSNTLTPHNVAYVSVGSPAGSDVAWAVQGALTQGDLTSWVLGAKSSTRVAAAHAVDAGASYGAQRYEGGNRAALAAVGDGNRNAGSVYGYDHWSVTRNLLLSYGARYADYGYLGRALFSPSIEVRYAAAPDTWVRGHVSQRMTAPGAEEFVPTSVAGIWLPPQRTFAPLDGSFRAERARHLEIGFERQLESFVINARGFRQDIDDQLITLFGVRELEEARTDLGHYYTANAGNVAVFGWAVGVSRPIAPRVRGSVEFSSSHANWGNGNAGLPLAHQLTTSVRRVRTERIVDLTTSVETDIPETATRVSATYKVNTAYAPEAVDATEPEAAVRFDVQVSQRLPFLAFTSADWEVLVAVRNLFRDSLDGASIYDELLVVRPPKQIVGGLLVRF